MSASNKVDARLAALIGKPVVIRLVTMIYTGILEDVTDDHYILTKCAWIFVGGDNDCEPYPEKTEVFVNRAGRIDSAESMPEYAASHG